MDFSFHNLKKFKRSIPQFVLFYTFWLVLISLLLPSLLWLYQEKKLFDNEARQLKTEFIEKQKKALRDETNNIIDYFNYKKKRSDEKFKTTIKERVYQAYQIATNIYKNNLNDKPKQEIKKMIKNALYPLRYGIGNECYYIGRMDGFAEFYPRNQQLVNTNISNIQDAKGHYVIRDEIALVKKIGEGFVEDYWFKEKTLPKTPFQKTSYLKYFKPFDWYFATGAYISDIDAELQEELIDRMSNIKTGSSSTLSIYTFDGQAIITNNKIDSSKNIAMLEDSLTSKLLNLARNAATNTDGDYIYYRWFKNKESGLQERMSFVKSFDNWGWIIDVGVFINDFDNDRLVKENVLHKKELQQIFFILAMMVVLFTASFLIAKYLSRRIKSSFDIFTNFFIDASSKSALIYSEKLTFEEFKNLSEAANRMIKTRYTAEQELAREKSLLRSLVDSIPDMIFFKDNQGKYLGCNRAFEEYINKTEAMIINKLPFDIFPQQIAQQYFNEDIQIFKTHTPLRNVHYVTFRNGKTILYDTVKTIYFDHNGNILGLMGISRDITELKKTEEMYKKAKEKAEESDKLKTAFLANMSHEIRTPMNAIMGFSKLLLEPSISKEEQSQFVSYIHSNGITLLKLINDIIDISLIDSEQVFLQQNTFDLNKLMSTIAEEIEVEKITKQKDYINIILNCPNAETDFNITLDERRMKQILINLIGNSLKFTDDGFIEFGYLEKLIENKRFIEFYVKDTGKGIPPEKMDLLFNRFTKLDDNKTRLYAGTGLGLAISKRIIELCGGHIWVDSEPGIGSTFSFLIPLDV